jgi:AcrR family transcriptional regulator
MASPRRLGSEDSETRARLLDATEALMLEQGYAAVTSRRVAARAGLKPQLVHYYFRSMDDLFLAAFRRRADRGLDRHARALASDRPLRAIWHAASDPRETALTLEFAALANHRKAISSEIARYAERFRRVQVEAITVALERHGVSTAVPPVALHVAITGIIQMLAIEAGLGVTLGHAETVAMVERHLDQLEPEDPVGGREGSGAASRGRPGPGGGRGG